MMPAVDTEFDKIDSRDRPATIGALPRLFFAYIPTFI